MSLGGFGWAIVVAAICLGGWIVTARLGHDTRGRFGWSLALLAAGVVAGRVAAALGYDQTVVMMAGVCLAGLFYVLRKRGP
jgi:hypothetical protein